VHGTNEPLSAIERLLCFVLFEEVSSFFEIVDAAVDGDFVFAGVFWDRDDAVDAVTALSDGFDEKVDIYHGRKSTSTSRP
jgi:hypothetical protein